MSFFTKKVHRPVTDHNGRVVAQREEEEIRWDRLITVGSIVFVLFVAAMSFGGPHYTVWSRGMRGKAELAQAEWNRQIVVEEARAQLESAKALRAAEVERANGVAEANRIIGESLADNEAYLRYLWIQGLNDSSGEVIYIPTEANLPILEANRRSAVPE